MGAIVDNLLSASLVSFGTIELDLEPIQVQLLLDQALEMNADVISQRRHLVTVTISDDLWVCADRIQCPLIISNLLMNAAKYTPPGGQIFIDVKPERDLVILTVKDTGVGIAASDMQEIFQIFGQSKQPIDRAKGGIGLGLPLARRLAERHGGSLSAHSEGIGEGSEFVLNLKRVLPPAPVTDHDLKSDRPVRLLDILIVEDNVDTADALALYYQLSGHVTRIAYCAADAIRMVTERQPDVVLSDVGLPDVDGYTLIRNIQDISLVPNPTFIALTGYASDADKAAALAAGFDGHLSKPVDLARLDDMLLHLRSTDH
jgi:CheY-like chemotaxis protein